MIDPEAEDYPLEWDDPYAFREERDYVLPADRVVWAHRLDHEDSEGPFDRLAVFLDRHAKKKGPAEKARAAAWAATHYLTPVVKRRTRSPEDKMAEMIREVLDVLRAKTMWMPT